MRKGIIFELKSSAERIGQLYPILVDHHGNIIDGEHRHGADEGWRTIRLDHIRTKKDLLIARIISNTVRRSVSRKEKAELLEGLGQIYLSEGVEPGRIAYRISEETGMSYQWVMRYLPERFKDPLQSQRAKPALRRRAGEDELTEPLKEKILTIVKYANVSFVNVILERSVYTRLEEVAERLETTPNVLISNAILLVLRRLERTASTPSRSIAIGGS